VSVRRQILGLDIRLVLGLGVKLGLILDLSAKLRYRHRFSVVDRRPIGRTQSDIWV